jgi:hypothetical protein
VTSAKFPLAELGEIGPYFALLDGGPRAGFEPVTSLVDGSARADALLVARIDEVSARLGTAQQWIGASVLFQGWAARLTSVYAGSAVLSGQVPDLAVARLSCRLPPSGPVDLLAVPLVAADPEAGWQLLTGHLDLLAVAMRRQVRIGQHLLRGNLASALAGSLMALHHAGHGPLDTLLGHSWAQPAGLRRYGRWRVTPDGPQYARTTCCGYVRLPGGGRCGDCSLTWREAARRGRPGNGAGL